MHFVMFSGTFLNSLSQEFWEYFSGANGVAVTQVRTLALLSSMQIYVHL